MNPRATTSAGEGEQLPLLGEAPAPAMPMLTLWRPWALACAQGVKAQEFRARPPPRTIVGRPLALHAGLQWDGRALDWLRAHCGVDWSDRDPGSWASSSSPGGGATPRTRRSVSTPGR
jgi:hypothetical protein